MDFSELIAKKEKRFQELEKVIGEPDFFNDPRAAGETMREFNRTKAILKDWNEIETARQNLEENTELAKGEDELAEMAREEIPELEEKIEKLNMKIQYALLPHDPTEDRDALVEIRAGAGGDEASLFAGDLLRMYQRYCELNGFKSEVIETSPSEVGGFKEVIMKVSGDEVFRHLKYESGVHRVQRVPTTETQGRIHTSTATVAVMPEAEEIDVELKPEDLDIQFTRSGGPGGQHVNTTDSAAQITHIPTGIQVKCQEGRSQGANKERGLQILRAKLLVAKKEEELAKYSEQRKSQIGSGGREEKIRTYNFPQNRVTDHRINLTISQLDRIIQGELSEFISNLQTTEMNERLEAAGLAV